MSDELSNFDKIIIGVLAFLVGLQVVVSEGNIIARLNQLEQCESVDG